MPTPNPLNISLGLAVEMWRDVVPLPKEWEDTLVELGGAERDEKGRIKLTPLGLEYAAWLRRR